MFLLQNEMKMIQSSDWALFWMLYYPNFKNLGTKPYTVYWML